MGMVFWALENTKRCVQTVLKNQSFVEKSELLIVYLIGQSNMGNLGTVGVENYCLIMV